jgi:hypothetical protein
MKVCRALVWDGLNGDGRCGRDATIELEKRWYCERCAKCHVNGNLDYSLYYLNTMVEKLADITPSLVSDKSLDLFLLKGSIQNAIDFIIKIKEPTS